MYGHIDIISRYSTQLPHLAKTFEEVISLSPQERLQWAKRKRKEIYRDGWFINTPVGDNGDGEIVDSHVGHLDQLIDRYFPSSHKARAKAYAEYHDDHETIAHAVIKGIKRDLNPRFNSVHYQMPDEDKKIIETAAADVLFETEPEVKALLLDYHESQDAITKNFYGIDKICVMWRCVEYIENGKYKYDDFGAYWKYWNPQQAQAKLPSLVSEIYLDDLWPKAEKLRHA